MEQIAHKENNHQAIVRSPDREGWLRLTTTKAPAILAACPTAIVVGATDAGPQVDVPWSQETSEVLADCGVAHVPYMTQVYDYPGTFSPFPHQYRISGFMSTHKRGFILAETGTGKTASAIWAIDYLLRIGRARRVLVVCPMSLLRFTWLKEFKHLTPNTDVTILHGASDRRKILAQDHAHVHIVNFDGVEVVYDQLLANQYDIVVIDESTAYKNINRRWKFMRPLVANSAWVWLMSATPVAQSPMDAHGQVKLLYGSSWAVTQSDFKMQTMLQLSKFVWRPKPEAAKIVQDVMQPAIYVKKRDVLKDLPPLMLVEREVDLSAGQTALIKELKKEALALMGTHTITAVHAAALRTKIIQIASGAVYSETGEVVEVDCKNRVAELLDMVKHVRERAVVGVPNNKVLVFCAFKHTARMVNAALTAAGYKSAEVDGEASPRQRDTIFNEFQNGAEIECIVAVPEVMAHGLTLTAASTVVWFTPHSRAEVYQQACGRIERPGQKFSMEIVHIHGSEAERNMYTNLRDRAATQADVLSGYAEIANLL